MNFGLKLSENDSMKKKKNQLNPISHKYVQLSYGRLKVATRLELFLPKLNH